MAASSTILSPLLARFLQLRRSMGKRPRAEVVDEQIAAAGEGEVGLAGLDAQDVGVEQGQVGPFVEGGEADLVDHLAPRRSTSTHLPRFLTRYSLAN